jgi:hypothetical protein
VPVGQQPLEAALEPDPRVVVDPCGPGGAGPVASQLDVDQQLGHARRPTLPGLVGDRLQLADQVGAAQRVAGVLVAPVRRPAVVHRHPREARQHPGGVHRLLAPLGMHREQAQARGGGRVDPVQPARQPRAGLVEVRHRRDRQPVAHGLDEPG